MCMVTWALLWWPSTGQGEPHKGPLCAIHQYMSAMLKLHAGWTTLDVMRITQAPWLVLCSVCSCTDVLLRRPPDAIRAAAPHVTPLRPGPRALTRQPDAEWRWMLLRLYVKSRQAYK